MLIVNILLFILGLILVIKGGDWFVDGSVGIAHRFRIPEIIVGATVVSIGTTLPEVMVSATAAVGGQGGIAYGNAIGSIICNTALIAAITVTLRPGKVDRKALVMPVLFFFGSAAAYCLNAYLTGYFSREFGLLLLGIFVVYMIVTVRQGFKNPAQNAPKEEETHQEAAEAPKTSLVKELALLVVGAVLIAVGATLLKDNATVIAQRLGVPESVIGLTIVALGTSLPELVTAITSLVKGHGSLSLGNVIGANLFNLVLVSGVSTVLAPFAVPQTASLFGQNASLVMEIPVMLTVMALLTLPTLLRGKLARFQGFALLAIYAAFLVVQFIFVVPV